MTHKPQSAQEIWSASLLRRDLNARAQHLATTNRLLHEQTTGTEPSIIFGHDEKPEKAEQATHGNFHPASYAAICANPDWARRLTKTHTAHRRVRARADWQWMELDCANSSDALLMNIFCHPSVFTDGHLNIAVANLLSVPTDAQPNFGLHPGVPLRQTRRPRTKRSSETQENNLQLFQDPSAAKTDRTESLKDRTEIDLQLGNLFIEAKLTESNFQTASLHLIERYRDLEAVFAVDQLPQRGTPTGAGPIQGYQLIRNVLAAFAADASFCVLCDARRRDLIEIWYSVLSAVHYPSFAWRLKLLTWQELATTLPEDLQNFLEVKYGIIPADLRLR
ncbi:PGN_0703 family putative restriction endonuclease [Tunturiibacter lichenicola]|uniref:PGN_0703 family putative restriction endonuclease n=1 Tax=Tunturiibacter lichenicola TaxID=2051959 RepID=UPI003D9B5F4D